jgi:hypothetical protein
MAWVITVAVLAFAYFVKELGDYKKIRAKEGSVPEELKMPGNEIFDDMVMDFLFVSVGIFTGASLTVSLLDPQRGVWEFFAIIGVAVFILLMLVPGKRYLVNKSLWAKSGLPFLTDVSQSEDDVLATLKEHLIQQISSAVSSQVYIGSFDRTLKLMIGISRRHMVAKEGHSRRVRYWHQQELLEHLLEERPCSGWTLAKADLNLVWINHPSLGDLTGKMQEAMKSGIWFVGSSSSETLGEWQGLVGDSPLIISQTEVSTI